MKVNNPTVGSRTEEADHPLHSSNFWPRGSPGYTPQSPTPDPAIGDQIAEAVLVQFIELQRSDKYKRLNETMMIICTNTDQEHINQTLGKTETNELYRSLFDVSLLPDSITVTIVVLWL